MKKTLTEIVYILDRSGSMSGLEADTIGGFNSMIEKQRQTGERAYVSTVLFDDRSEGIKHIINIHKYAREEDRPDKTIFVITTDGMENASINYNYKQVKKMIEKEQKEYGWEFIFIGANIDACAEAERFGIRKERAVNYIHDDRGTNIVYAGLSKALSYVMKAKDAEDMEEYLDDSNWEDEIAEDYLKRKK